MSRRFSIAAFTVIVCFFRYGDAARILGIFPTASISHQVVFRGLTLELNKRGHELVVVTTDPINDPTLKNYTEIDINYIYEKRTNINIVDNRDELMHWLTYFYNFVPLLHESTEQVLSHPDLMQLYAPNSNEKFDLMLMEMLYWPAFLPLANRFDVPIVGMASLGLPINVQYGIGNPIITSHPSIWEISTKDFGSSTTFWQRLVNFYQVWKYLYCYRTEYMAAQDKIARKYFGDDIPPLHEIEKNVSLIFENQLGPISFVKPNVPNVIEIGGFHVSTQVETLNKDLQKILDEATQGFVYMSLGSNVRSNMLSAAKRAEFIAAFTKLPYTVIWKFEDDELPGKPDNVLIIKWAPQQAILAHPNLKVFIYQGGLQSTEEAISHGVPLIGLPVFADQDMQVNKMVSLGVAKKLEISDVNRDDLLEAIRTVVLDRSYKQRMLSLRSFTKDRPHDLIENAIWWTEFVIRHRGAPYMRSTTVDEPWYSRQDMDIIAFITAGSVIALGLALIVLYQFIAYSVNVFTNMTNRGLNHEKVKFH